jgi:ADP-ribose pyrophosphatase
MPLPPHRAAAVDDYLALLARHPELFPPRRGLPLVLDRDELTAFAERSVAEQGDAAPIVGLAARTPWHLFVTDVVRTPRGLSTYDRLIHASLLKGCHGAAVVATLAADCRDCGGGPGDLVLVRQERHATGRSHWEIPRGFGDPGLSGGELAAKELREETGYVGRPACRLATVHTNTGTTPEEVGFYHIEVTGRVESDPEAEEPILDRAAWPIPKVWDAVRRGEITDAFTIQGVALLEHRA